MFYIIVCDDVYIEKDFRYYYGNDGIIGAVCQPKSE